LLFEDFILERADPKWVLRYWYDGG
jgi:hypothetical protein